MMMCKNKAKRSREKVGWKIDHRFVGWVVGCLVVQFCAVCFGTVAVLFWYNTQL